MRQAPVSSIELRVLSLGDSDDVLRLLADERVVRYMLFPRFTDERAKAFTARFLNGSPQGVPPQVVRAVTAGGTAEVIGLCGVVLDGATVQGEIWYLIDPEYWGRGVGTRAVAQLLRHCFETLGLHRVWASCLPENPPSAKILLRSGFRHEGNHKLALRIQGRWCDSETYALLADEWRAATNNRD